MIYDIYDLHNRIGSFCEKQHRGLSLCAISEARAKFRGDRPLWGRDLKGGGASEAPPPSSHMKLKIAQYI